MKFICFIPLLVSLAAASPKPWGIFSAVANAVNDVRNVANTAIHGALDLTGTVGSGLLNGANCVVDDTAHVIGKAVPALGVVTNGIQSITNGVNSVGQNVISDTANAAQNVAGAVTGLAANTVNAVANAASPVSAAQPAPVALTDSESS